MTYTDTPLELLYTAPHTSASSELHPEIFRRQSGSVEKFKREKAKQASPTVFILP